MLNLARANASTLLKGYSAPGTIFALNEAKRLLDAGVGTDLQRFSVLRGLVAGHFFASQMYQGLNVARQAAEVADRLDDSIYRLVAHRLLGTMYLLMGDYQLGLERLDWAERFRQPERDKALSYQFSNDPGLIVVIYQVMALMFLGAAKRARLACDELRSEISDHGHANTVATGALHLAMWPAFAFGDLDDADRQLSEVEAECIEQKLQNWLPVIANYRACIRATNDPSLTNIQALRDAIEASHRSGARLMDTIYLSHLAEALVNAGDTSAARVVLNEARDFVERSGERIWFADICRVDGRLALAEVPPRMQQAEVFFQEAIEVARQQHARLLELRAAVDLARLWRNNGRRDSGTAMLATLIEELDDGGAFRDVSAARAFLTEHVEDKSPSNFSTPSPDDD